MQFSFSEEQLALRDALRDLLAKECTPVHLRGAWTNETGRVPGLWEQLADMGVVGLVGPRRAHVRGRALLREQIAQRVAQGELLLGEREPHARGRPSTRSAITLRWISLVPA